MLNRAPASGALPAGAGPVLCLRADSGLGPLRLLLPAGQGSAAEAAIGLHRAAPWLDLLEDWLAPGQGLRWTPVDRGEDDEHAAPEGCIAAGIRSALAGPAGPQALWLDAAALFGRAAPPPALGLQWPAVAAELLLGRQDLPPEDLALLGAGSLLLLEASFAPDWQAWLRGRSDGRPGAGRCLSASADGRWLERAGGQAALAPRAGALEFRQALEPPMELARLLGWQALDPQDAPRLQQAAPVTLWWTGGERRGQAAREIARGRLLPWGRGQALQISELCDAELPARLQAERAWT